MNISSQRPNETDLGYAQRVAEHMAEINVPYDPNPERKFIDITPTWANLILPLIYGAKRDEQWAIDELHRLAYIADRLILDSKQQQQNK
jgi:hypothetical protein